MKSINSLASLFQYENYINADKGIIKPSAVRNEAKAQRCRVFQTGPRTSHPVSAFIPKRHPIINTVRSPRHSSVFVALLLRSHKVRSFAVSHRQGIHIPSAQSLPKAQSLRGRGIRISKPVNPDAARVVLPEDCLPLAVLPLGRHRPLDGHSPAHGREHHAVDPAGGEEGRDSPGPDEEGRAEGDEEDGDQDEQGDAGPEEGEGEGGAQGEGGGREGEGREEEEGQGGEQQLGDQEGLRVGVLSARSVSGRQERFFLYMVVWHTQGR